MLVEFQVSTATLLRMFRERMRREIPDLVDAIPFEGDIHYVDRIEVLDNTSLFVRRGAGEEVIRTRDGGTVFVPDCEILISQGLRVMLAPFERLKAANTASIAPGDYNAIDLTLVYDVSFSDILPLSGLGSPVGSPQPTLILRFDDVRMPDSPAPDPSASLAKERVRELLSSRALRGVVDLSSMHAFLGFTAKAFNVGASVDKNEQVVAFRIELGSSRGGPEPGTDLFWRRFFAGEFINLLDGNDWAVGLDGTLLVPTLGAQINKDLHKRIDDGLPFEVTKGPDTTLENRDGNACIKVEIEGNVTEPCNVGVKLTTTSVLEVPGPDTLSLHERLDPKVDDWDATVCAVKNMTLASLVGLPTGINLSPVGEAVLNVAGFIGVFVGLIAFPSITPDPSPRPDCTRLSDLESRCQFPLNPRRTMGTDLFGQQICRRTFVKIDYLRSWLVIAGSLSTPDPRKPLLNSDVDDMNWFGGCDGREPRDWCST